jgi:hypothetical protein
MVALISFDSDHFHPNFPGGTNSQNERNRIYTFANAPCFGGGE